MTPAQQLGLLGAQDEGLFLLLHADDVHKSIVVTKALRILYLSHPRHSERSLDSISAKIGVMLQSDLKLPRRIAKSWHDLLLTLLAVPNFKAALANASVDTYNHITGEYANGIGIFEKSSYTRSVQFLNRVAYVEDLVKERDLLGCLMRSLFETLSVAIKKKNDTMDESGNNSMAMIDHSRNRSAALTINMIHDVLDDYLNPLGPRSTEQWRGLFSGNERNETEQQNQTRFNRVLDPMHSVSSNR
jgi:hypothetical protein